MVVHAVDEDDAQRARDARQAAQEKHAADDPFLVAIEIHAPDERERHAEDDAVEGEAEHGAAEDEAEKRRVC